MKKKTERNRRRKKRNRKSKEKEERGKKEEDQREEYQEMRISEGDNLPLSLERAIVNSDVDKEKKVIIIQLQQSKFDGEKKERWLLSARRECLSSYEDSADVLNGSISTGHYIL